MKYFRTIFITVICLLVIFGINIKNNNKDQKAFVETFDTVGFDIEESNINVWCAINPKIGNNLGVEGILNMIVNQIGLKEPYNCEETINTDDSMIDFKKQAKNALTQIKVEKFNKDDLHETQYYAVVDIVIYKDFKSYISLKNNIEDVFKKISIEKPVSNITLVGHCPGNLDKKEKDKIVNNVFSYLNARTIDRMQIGEIYNVYGFTNIINDYIKVARNKVNVDLSLKYNKAENKTYLYLASPVITIEY